MINSAEYGSICAHGGSNAFFWMVHIEAQIRDSGHADTVEPGYNEHKQGPLSRLTFGEISFT